MRHSKVIASLSVVCLLTSAFGWSNRGHRMINQVAADTLPRQLPPFMLSAEARRSIAYLGPEPDRWRPVTEAELSATSSPDHVFRVELGEAVGNIPRRRNDFSRALEQFRAAHPDQAVIFRPEKIGTLPWQVEEVMERLKSAFRAYRLVQGEFPGKDFFDVEPMTKDDLPQIEATALFYAGWLGHYVGDGSMPLHDTINIAGWVDRNPHEYTTSGTIHHGFEQSADDAIAAGDITASAIEKKMQPPAVLKDPFADTLSYVRREGTYAETVYQIEKRGGIKGKGSAELQAFIIERMAEGGSMLRDLIYTAWVESADLGASNVKGDVSYLPEAPGHTMPTQK